MAEGSEVFANRMKHVERGLLTERGFSEYQNKLGFDNDDLTKWQTIVDLGSGLQQEFAWGVEQLGLESKVISVDPRLLMTEEEDLAGLLPEEQERRRSGRRNPVKGTIGAFAQHLPLENESIDAVLALHSVPQYTPEADELFAALREIVRILKHGGEARLYPISKLNNLNDVEIFLQSHNKELIYQLVEDKSEAVPSIEEKKFLLTIQKV